MNKPTYTMKELSTKLDKTPSDLRPLMTTVLDTSTAFKDNRGRWVILEAGYDILLAHLESAPSHPPSEPAIPIGMTQVPVHSLPLNTRLIMITIDEQVVRATVRPAIRKRLSKGNLVYVEHMEGDMYTVVRL